MLTREETIKAFECCYMTHNCKECPLDRQGKCYVGNAGNPEINKAVMHYLKETEPAPAATGTSSEVVSKDTNSTHLDDSTLLDICQEGIEEMAKIALDDYPNEFLTGYIEAFKDNIRRLRGEQSD
ncbi:MAG: hypothetical protein ACLUNP_09455 [Ruminococcus sp.]|jgi:hypothetical protein|uniref:hypothetical protein n=1 Tax=Ruminococcus sp. TaxID=41978 RepID=UPI002E783E21|nr:hypothetical protein [Ruminococcus sp.]MEE0837698.1 hypothetical protein [Ruminococcus sp.]